MAVDHAQQARWASRVLRLKQAGLEMSYEDVRETASAVEERPNPETAQLEGELGVGKGDTQIVGAAGHPLSGLLRSFSGDIENESYVRKLFGMDAEELVEEWRKQTGEAHKDLASEDVDACYESQDRDEQEYQDQIAEMQSTGQWPEAERLGHGYAMLKEAQNG